MYQVYGPSDIRELTRKYWKNPLRIIRPLPRIIVRPLTPANLMAMPHRAVEDQQTQRALSMIFADQAQFAVHAPLAHTPLLGDEGAANHNRLSASHGDAGVEVFIYGRDALGPKPDLHFPARQTLQASEAVARLHSLSGAKTVFHPQSAAAINAGAFHNDVVCVSNETVLFFHEAAFDDVATLENAVSSQASALGFAPHFIMARAEAVPLADVISSYLFNSQLVSLSAGGMALILPSQVEDTPSTKAFVDTHYRDRLTLSDLGDTQFLDSTRTALDALTQLLDLPNLYDFQRISA